MAAIQPSPQDTKGKALIIFARFHAREGQENAVAVTLREEVLQARTEPGCSAHNAYQSTRDPRLFFIHSRWIDEAAFEKLNFHTQQVSWNEFNP